MKGEDQVTLGTPFYANVMLTGDRSWAAVGPRLGKGR
jgi:hypothetical protein